MREASGAGHAIRRILACRHLVRPPGPTIDGRMAPAGRLAVAWRHVEDSLARADRARNGSGIRDDGHCSGVGRAAAAAEGLGEQAVPRHRRRQPFFWLGDTAWELFHRLNREEAERYLRNRAEQRFTVVQAVVLAELDGLREPNAYGHTPLRDNDPTQPNEEYFAHVDWIVARANALGLYVGCCRRGATSGTTKRGVGPGDLHAGERRALRRVARAAATRTPASSGFSAATGRSRPTRTATIIRGDGARPARRRRRRAPDHVPPDRRPAARRPGSTTTTGSTSTCGRTATSPSSPAATTRRASTTTARR